MVTLTDRLRRDLRRSDLAVPRSELPLLICGAAGIVGAAQWSQPGTPGEFFLLAVGGVALVCFALLRGLAMEVLAAAVLLPVAVAVGPHGDLELGLFLITITTLYTAWHLGSTVRAAAIAVTASAVIMAMSLADSDGYSWQPWVAAELFTWILGRLLQSQHRLIAELKAARTALAEQAVAEERRRIARDLHDLAGHTLAAILLQVTGARHVLRRDPAEADRALADAETVGRSSMDQIRATVAALRTTERGTDAAIPEAEQLEQLVDEYRRAGLSIQARIASEVASLDGPVGVALHRIGREALANVARHAPANHVEIEVEVDGRPEQVRLRVRDHGRAAVALDHSAGRHGLIGMQERARALGGSLEAEPTVDGWRVEAVLPLPSSGHTEVDR